jgi:hypothetical protein
VKTTWQTVWFTTPWGEPIFGHIHKPKIPGVYPGAVMVPGGFSPGTDYDRISGFITADDIAAMGFTVLHYDPSGRGKSGGREDYWGVRHQQELGFLIREFGKRKDVDAQNLGILSFSIGIVISAGALSKLCDHAVAYLLDWEGPSNRFNITKNDTFPPLKDFPSRDSAFWDQRDPSTMLGHVTTGYFRYQAVWDHVQKRNKDHAIELVNKAVTGNAAWTRVNDNPLDILFDESRPDQYHWIKPFHNHKGQYLQYLLTLAASKKNLSTKKDYSP